MSEPEYTFIKGQGWVLVAQEEYLDFESHGKMWRVIARKPNIGEIFCYAGLQNEIYVLNGKARLDQWASKFFAWNDPSKYHHYGGLTFTSNQVVVTVVPL